MTMTQQKLNMNDYYSTSDLALATTISLNFSIKEMDKTNPRKAIFIFDRNKKLDEYINRYWRKEILVEPRQYFDQLKALKARIYEEG